MVSQLWFFDDILNVIYSQHVDLVYMYSDSMLVSILATNLQYTVNHIILTDSNFLLFQMQVFWSNWRNTIKLPVSIQSITTKHGKLYNDQKVTVEAE